MVIWQIGEIKCSQQRCFLLLGIKNAHLGKINSNNPKYVVLVSKHLTCLEQRWDCTEQQTVPKKLAIGLEKVLVIKFSSLPKIFIAHELPSLSSNELSIGSNLSHYL